MSLDNLPTAMLEIGKKSQGWSAGVVGLHWLIYRTIGTRKGRSGRDGTRTVSECPVA
jgi:hypothetical protein